MSSTNRGGKRTPADYYPTPGWCVHRLLEAADLPGGRWLEPAAGDGHIIRAVGDVRDDVTWSAVELREDCLAALEDAVGHSGSVHIGDFLEVDADTAKPAVIVTNPPYSIAMEMLESALGVDGAVVVMLLRLNFLASARRAPLMRRFPPDVYVLPNRPSFSGKGTDSIEYAWFAWPIDRVREAGAVRVLRPTSPTERNENRRQVQLL